MNSFIEILNHWGGRFADFVWPMLWQSSLLIVILFGVEFSLRRRIRASIRYALWLAILLKLCLPPTFALPTSPAWWMHKVRPQPSPQVRYSVTFGVQPLPEISPNPVQVYIPPKPPMTKSAWWLLASGFVSACLLGWLLVRWRFVVRQTRLSENSEKLAATLNESRHVVGVKSAVSVKLTRTTLSPAVFGLFRPVILIPRSLADEFSEEQLRAVLVHELIHLKRCDVWVNCFQALLQVFYWWHPLLWFANARIRRIREEAVDDAVMLALREKAETYPPTLLEVAKLALNRPLASLGLVGIAESRSGLRQRIERLVNFRPPRTAGLTLISFLGIAVFTLAGVPMGGAPMEMAGKNSSGVNENLNRADSMISATAKLSNRSDAVQSPVARTFRIYHPIDENKLRSLLLESGVDSPPTVFFYRDNGILFVRGSMQQLELVRQVVLKLNGFSSKEIEASNKQFVKQFDATGSEEQTATNLFSRTFKVDAGVFTHGLRKIPGVKTNDVTTIARSLFSNLGVDWERPKGKSVIYNDQLGLLFVRASARDLDTIEGAVQALNQVIPQIHAKARFFVVPEGTLEGLGGSYKAFANTNYIAGILSSTNARIALRALLSRPDCEELAAPEVTTSSGLETEMRATQEISVITNFAFAEGLDSRSTITPQNAKFQTGPVLDMTASVLPDGYTIDLSTVASVTEFLGYSKPTNATVAYNSAGEKIDLPTVLPSFRVRKTSAHVRLFDDQTVVLGGLKPHFFEGGKEVSAEPAYFKKRNRFGDRQDEMDSDLLVFITVTLIDPVGNRIHSDADLAFANNSIPPQNSP